MAIGKLERAWRVLCTGCLHETTVYMAGPFPSRAEALGRLYADGWTKTRHTEGHANSGVLWCPDCTAKGRRH